MKFTNFEKRMFLAARAEAEKSDYDRFHIGCVITYKNKIIGGDVTDSAAKGKIHSFKMPEGTATVPTTTPATTPTTVPADVTQ